MSTAPLLASPRPVPSFRYHTEDTGSSSYRFLTPCTPRCASIGVFIYTVGDTDHRRSAGPSPVRALTSLTHPTMNNAAEPHPSSSALGLGLVMFPQWPLEPVRNSRLPLPTLIDTSPISHGHTGPKNTDHEERTRLNTGAGHDDHPS